MALLVLGIGGCSPSIEERCTSWCEEQKSCPSGDPEDCDETCSEVTAASESGCEAEAGAFYDCLEEAGTCSNWDDICRAAADDFAACANAETS